MTPATFAVTRKEVYTTKCELDATLYEVQAAYDNELLQDLQLESADDLIRLRDTLTVYINEHLTPYSTNDNDETK